MSFSYPGGIISSTENVPTTTAPYCGGIWKLSEAAYWKAQGQWPYGPSDPNFENVTLLLNGDGTNGAQNNTFLDSSTNNFSITRNGNTTQGSFSPYGSNWSNYITTSNYLTAPANAAFQMGSGDFTIEAWIFPTATAGADNSEILSYGAPNEFDGWHFYQIASTNVLSFGLNYAGLIVSSTAALALNTWTHVAVTRSGNSFKLWINGTNDGTATSSTSQSTNASDNLYVGTASYGQAAGRSFNGYISNARVVKGSVVYSATFTPSTTPLTAITNTSVLTCQSNRFIDNSTNNFTLTINGTPSVQRFSPFNPTAPYSTSVIGGSGYFDGSGDYLSAANNAAFAFGTGDFTMECWYYSGVTGQQSVMDTRATGNGPGVLMYTLSNALRVYSNGVDYVGSLNVPSNSWTHLVVERISGALYTYVNGARDINGTAYTPNLTDNSFIAGFDTKASNFGVNGYLADAKIVKGTGLYSGATFTLPTAPMTATTGTEILLSYTNAGIPDLAMQNNLETVGNAQVSTSVKKYGTGSLAFDGTGDYLSTSPNRALNFGTGDFTVEFWLYTTTTATKFVFSQCGTSAGRDGVVIGFNNSTSFYWLFGDGSNWVFERTPSGTVSTNTWMHIAVVRNSGTARYYVNGVQIDSIANTTNLSQQASNISYVGGNPDGFVLNGYMDDVRITTGLCRYPNGTTFTPPTVALPTY